MPDVTLPYTFANGAGNVIDATQVNANFQALRDGVNDITLDQIASAVQALLVPTGAVMPFGGDAAPTGWLLADGSVVSRTTYAALFAVYSTKFGAGDGSTTFGLPNLKGKGPVGRDAAIADFDTVGESGGSRTIAAGQLPAHTHPDNIAVAANTVTPGATPWFPVNDSSWGIAIVSLSGGTVRVPAPNGLVDSYTNGSHAHSKTGGVQANTPAGSAYDQPFQVFNYIVKI